MAAPNLTLPGTPVFNSYVKEELDLRQTVLEQRLSGFETSDVLLNHVARAPWIRMMSSVELSSSRAREFGINVPQGSYTRALASQNVLTSIIGTNGEDIPFGYEISNSYGIRPQPGITGMNIISHNRFGSLRTMTVEFVCWDAVQLDILELLYMRPGYTILVEWGHSTYYSEGRVRNVSSGLEDKFFSRNLTKHEITAEINSLRKTYNGNYDGFFGFVKNFNWSLRVDGGYDCKTSLVGLGELAESIPVVVPVATTEVQKELEQEVATQQFEESRERFAGQDNTNIKVPGTSQAELDALRRATRETGQPTFTQEQLDLLPPAIEDNPEGIQVQKDISLETNINDAKLRSQNTSNSNTSNSSTPLPRTIRIYDVNGNPQDLPINGF